MQSFQPVILLAPVK